MALPTTPRYWTNRKGLYEEAIVRQRNQDHDFRQKWAETAEYFRKSNVLAAKQNEWTSGKYQNKCFDKFKNSCERDLKAIKLRRRQEQLRSLLLEETMRYEAELKRLSRDNYFHIEEMKERAEGLRSSREEKRKQVADQKLYEHWQLNNPDIRKVQSELMKEQVVDHWSQQQEEAKQREEQERQEKEELERQMEEERLAAVKHAQQKEEERHKEEIELQEHLRQQMTELKLQEVEAKELKHQHDLLLQEQWEMERLEAQRQRKEEQRKKLALGRALLHQHKTQMMHKSKVIQEELEQDRLLLEEMIRREQEDLSLRTARREKAKADAEWMKQVIEDQLRLEKSREAEMDMLFQDEAARMWQQREGEWERERRARQRLMDEVLTVRQQQIAEKIEEVKRRQQESLDRREELLKELEISNQLTQREQEKIQAEQVAIKHDLKEQIGEHQNIEKLAKLNLKEEEEQEQKADAEYQNFVQQETDRMRQQGYTPRFVRKKHAWT